MTTIENKEKKQGTAGFIGRFKPLHHGAALVLETLCQQAESVKIGIGSANKYNLRNPFTAEETEGMIRAYLAPRFRNFQIYHISDFGQIPNYADGEKWKEHVVEKLGSVDYFVSGNPHTSSLLEGVYAIIDPKYLIPAERYVQLRATEVRVEMAKGSERWKEMVPPEVAKYILDQRLQERLQREFGKEILLSIDGNNDYRHPETMDEERRHIRER